MGPVGPDHWKLESLFHPLIVTLAAGWLLIELGPALAAARDAVLRRPVYPGGQMYLPSLVRCAPAARASRHHLRPTPEERRAMATDDSDRITSSHWPPRTEPAGFPAPGNHFPEPGKPRPDRRGLIAGGLALLGTLAAFAIAGGGYLAYTKLTASSTFTANGWLMLKVSDSTTGGIDFADNLNCSGANGYNDIASGATVTVRDSTGKTVAIGALQSGQPAGERNQCTFPLIVEGIPGGSKFYSFEVSHRGQVTMTRAAAAHPMLTLGS